MFREHSRPPMTVTKCDWRRAHESLKREGLHAHVHAFNVLLTLVTMGKEVSHYQIFPSQRSGAAGREDLDRQSQLVVSHPCPALPGTHHINFYYCLTPCFLFTH